MAAAHEMKMAPELHTLDDIRNKEVICDFEVRVGEESFSVHRTVLAASSKYFQDLFSLDTKEVREGFIVLKEVTADSVKRCVDYMYTGEADISFENMNDLLYTSTLMQLDGLRNLCCFFVLDNLTVENCLVVRSLAQTFGREEEVKRAEMFVKSNLSGVIHAQGFSDPSYDNLDAAWSVIKTWIGSNVADRENCLQRLAQATDFKKLPPKFVFATVLQDPLLSESKSLREMVAMQIFSNIQIVKQNINAGNCYKLKRLAKDCADAQKKAATDVVGEFMSGNFEIVAAKEAFEGLEEGEVTEFLRVSEVVYFREHIKWNAVLRWVTHFPNRKKSLHKLLGTLKLSRFSEKFIKENMLGNNLVSDCRKCKDFLLRALSEPVVKNRPWIAVLNAAACEICGIDLQTSDKIVLARAKTPKFATLRLLCSVDGTLYLLLNNQLSSLDKTGNWLEKASMRHVPAPEAEITVYQGMICVIEVTATSFYSPIEDRWEENLPKCGLWSVCCIAAGEDFLYAFSASMPRKAVKYEQATRSWSEIATMKYDRHTPAAAVMQGRAYLMGGKISERSCKVVECYDPSTDSWSEIASMNKPRWFFTACVIGDALYAVGGSYDGTGRRRLETDSLEVYDAKTCEWTMLRQIQVFEGFVSSCVTTLD